MSVTKPLTVKEHKVLNAYVETGSLAKAGLLVKPDSTKGAAAVATHGIVNKGNVLSRLEQVFDSVGLTEQHIASKLKDKSDAKRQLFFAHNGIVTETREVEDNHTQLKALEMAARLRGMDIQRHANLNLNMTPNDLAALKNNDLDELLRQCDDELKKVNG